MTLTGELLKHLDNEEESPAKRFKIASDAFESVDPITQHREMLKWLLKSLDNCNIEAWTLFQNWLKSNQVNHFKLTDITQEDVRQLTQAITCLVDSESLNYEVKTMAFNSAMILLENEVIRHYFKHDIKNYFKLLRYILESVTEEEVMLSVIKSKNLYCKFFVNAENFHKYFFDLNLNVLSNIVHKFEDSKAVFQEVSKIIQLCLFQKNFKDFEGYFKTFFDEENVMNETPALPKLFIKHLQKCYKTDSQDVKITFKLLLYSLSESYPQDFSLLYMFLILTFDLIGFDLSKQFQLCKRIRNNNDACEFHKATGLLAEVFDVLSDRKINLNCRLGNISFSDFIQNTVLSLISLTNQPNEDILKIMNHSFTINPLIAETIVSEILIYVMLPDNYSCRNEYEKLMTNVFKIFAKLNRVQHLISRMIRSLKSNADGNKQMIEKAYTFDGIIQREPTNFEDQIQNILPLAVLDCFTQCITTIASWQTVNLFKTFQFHLESVVNEDLQVITKNFQCVIYIEILCALTCQLLKSVRMAEHTVINVGKFINCMEEFKIILGKYGVALVAMEHNLTLMRGYLNICYVWAELYIILSYYSVNNEVSFTKNLDSDYSACNITYMHSYLTTEQWCLISQRITNFGEKPCKQIMHKLFTQRLKSMQLFENNVNEEIANLYTKSLTQSLEDCWEIVVQDAFVLDIVMPRMHNNDVLNLADYLIKKIIDDGIQILENTKVLDNSIFVNAIVYLLLSKITKVFKHKWKQSKPPYSCVTIFETLHKGYFMSGDESMIQYVIDTFHNLEKNTVQERELDNVSVKLNKDKIFAYLDVLKSLPILSLKQNIKIVVFIYLLSVLTDVHKYITSGSNLKEILENILIGILQRGAFTLAAFDCEILVKSVLRTFTNYPNAIEYIIEKMFKSEDLLQTMKNVINYLMQNLHCNKCLCCTGVILSGFSKHRKTKVMLKMKDNIQECKALMDKKLIKLVTSENKENVNNLLQIYILLLRDSLTQNNPEKLEMLSLHLAEYIEITVNISNSSDINNKDRLALFSTVLLGRNKFESVKDDFIINVWNTCMKLEISDEDFEAYSKLVPMIFQHISNDEFSKIIEQLLQITLEALKEKDHYLFMKKIKVWHCILFCNFNVTKVNTCQNAFESLMYGIITAAQNTHENDEFCKEITKFNVQLIEAVKLPLTATICDLIFLTLDSFMRDTSRFAVSFVNCIAVLEALLKFRNIYITDRLPSFLQLYRLMFSRLIEESNSNVQLSEDLIKNLSDCSHKLEKLTKQLLGYNKHLTRVSMYLIADILHQYEIITVHPSVKMHISNCIYSLISLCDQHAISYLMRVLSTASTEMFKFMYDTYKKYYRFTGKV